jgi:outer membrane receptor for ferric coprogen and ferric-rhodotorulic acid
MAVVAVAGHELHAQQAPAPQISAKPATPETPSEILKLSPFVVDSAADQGYYSSQTLAGGRLKTDLKDVATSVQVVTDVMLEDLGLTNLNDVLAYTTNTDALGGLSNYTLSAACV